MFFLARDLKMGNIKKEFRLEKECEKYLKQHNCLHKQQLSTTTTNTLQKIKTKISEYTAIDKKLVLFLYDDVNKKK